jgi:hypothetical protein
MSKLKWLLWAIFSERKDGVTTKCRVIWWLKLGQFKVPMVEKLPSKEWQIKHLMVKTGAIQGPDGWKTTIKIMANQAPNG